jgi:hypothetical protein
MRLTQETIRIISGRALKAAFKQRLDDIRQQEHDLAMACWEHVFTADARNHALAAPTGWIRQDRCLRFNMGFRQTTLNLNNTSVPVPHSTDCRTLGTIHDETLNQRFTDFERDRNALQSERERANQGLFSLLNSAKTMKRLAEIWPEGLPFYERELEVSKRAASVPAVISEDVNKLLGLAPQATAA